MNGTDRQNNIIIEGIPNEIQDDHLEEMVRRILCTIDANLFEIEDCHRMNARSDPGVTSTIATFVNRRSWKAALKNKGKLKSVSIENVGAKCLFINDNLNSYYKKLAAKCRRLKGLVR